MLNQAVQDAMNEQIKNELFSAYQYLSMAAYCESESLPGFAHWMRAQAQEETVHAMKFYDFILERNGRVVLGPIDGPLVEFGSPLEVFQSALEHERKVTGMIHDLYGLAVRENDYASQAFLQWFVTEQIEEVSSMDQLLRMIQRAGESGLLVVEQFLGAGAGEAAGGE